jgi:signal transduction histidine kinase
MDDVHRISSDLRPSVLDDMGIISALKWTCKKMIENAPGISVTTRIEVEEEDVPSKLKIGVYRIVQEALNNVVRHSGADRVELFLGTDDNRLVLQIRDNGRGFDPDAVQRDASEESMGLESIQERVEITGGRCVIDSEKTAGTTIRASWTMP